jgi:rubrerythrin
MDEETKNRLQNFDRVWSRVNGGAEQPPAQENGDAEALREFIADESRDEAFYRALAGRAGAAARTLRCIAADERGHRRDLQMEYFMLTGDTYAAEPSCPVAGPVLDAMRSACANELKGAENYLAAAGATKSERLGELYRLHASDEKTHAEALRSLIYRALC